VPSADEVLEDPRQKLDRAGELMDKLYDDFNGFLHPILPYRFSVRRVDHDNFEFFIHFERDLPHPDWGLRVGEFAHNARGALDHLVWQLVLASDNVPSKDNQFPISTERDRYWKGGRDFRLKGVDERFRKPIDDAQPFLRTNPREHELWALQTLSNIDKHQVIHPAYIAPVGLHPIAPPTYSPLEVSVDPPGARYEVDLSVVAGPYQDGDLVARAKVWTLDPRTSVAFAPSFKLGVAFGDIGLDARALRLIYEFIDGFFDREIAPVLA
jgi:hypothetical protein